MNSFVSFIKKHCLLIIFLTGYFVFGFLTYKEWPIANGEEYRYLRGKETIKHLTSAEFKEDLLQPIPNYFLYNLYPMVLVLLNPTFIYEWFHLMSFLFASVGFIATYLIGFKLYGSSFKSFLVINSLVFFPRFFGQLAINPVDMPFMVFYLISLLLLILYAKKPTNHFSTILIGIVFGITQAIRQLGFTVYILLVILDIYDYFQLNNKPSLKVYIKEKFFKYFYIFVIANLFMLITWPNFAINFFKSYNWYLFIGSNFYLWDFGLLFNGEFLENFQRPWYYLPFFQFITYPVYIVALFLITFYFFKSKLKNRIYFLLTSALFVNYLLYFVLNPVLYDGIRHFLFLIPIIVLISFSNMFSLIKCAGKKILFYLLIVAIIFNIGTIFKFYLNEFPYIYPYFNKYAYLKGDPYKLYESDYANTKYKEAAVWLREDYLKDESVYSHSDLDRMLKVFACDNGYAVDYYSHKKFLTVIHKKDADLTLCDYRNLKQSGYTGKIINTFYLNNNDILYLIKN